MQSVTNIQNLGFREILALDTVDIGCKNICECADCVFAFNKMVSLVESCFNTRKANITRSVDLMTGAFDLSLRTLSSVSEIKDDEIGNYIGCELTDDFVLNHYFECLKKGYRGWKWAVTVSCVEGFDTVTVCEVDILPGDDALLAPEWVPWEKRLLASDFAPGEYIPEEVIERTREFIEKRKAEILPPKLVEGQGIFSTNWQ